jgi:short-subunit dehydrogenase
MHCRQTIRKFGNAGLAEVTTIEEIQMAEIDRMVDVNLRATVLLTQAVVPAMKAKRRGRIINLGSRAAIGKPGQTVYSARKERRRLFDENLGAGEGADGITVNTVTPAPIATEMFYKGNPPDGPAAKGSDFCSSTGPDRNAAVSSYAWPIGFEAGVVPEGGHLTISLLGPWFLAIFC